MLSGEKKLFEQVQFDEEGKYLVLHHEGAKKYYKWNVAILLFFFGSSFLTYKFNTAVFWNDTFAKIYLGIVFSGLLGLWIFAHKHIQRLYLLKGQKEIGIMTYTNFGMSINRLIKIPVDKLEGTRLFWTRDMNVF